ncbi:16S rRNA (cytosine967-C5)-methyltransferase [Meinhardsimonia xiamenensis]|jgi:16S rRNA (cytosine967-C5)-methyltransferase|uniref:16S rRNA (Cytosine967-C5)-methyltransferase n=1 Tax=Meinhardsimonia xiamenensis TaxID=990712 RepID=A0A1G9E4Q7_9RHOB|nr:RsmB/NOP family class I SAM-dependent RNA methyltransferase [Meinhardsimonia xiamenensis]PRX33925.1 16S rRNA (cytosine967-C5)-methyltransferase [Meinhardsimonia xiamenensis]SDK71125.1 16S rRNA (cytosine967-C5)-methyltransferase [Meinhardsimonia xiamenensis]
MSKGLAARAAALDILVTVLERRLPLSEAVPPAVAGLEPAERARAARLAGETLRWLDRADRMLKPFLSRPPPLRVRNVLRLALVEIFVAQAPPHAAVDAAVSLARRGPRGKAMAGLVNAVLRRATAEGPERWEALALPRLPKWLRAPLLKRWGREVVEAIEAAHLRPAPLDLTPRDGDAQALAERLGAMALPTGSVRLQDSPQLSALPGYAEGAWWVQDAAAALPARVLAAKPGERVLDLCAAPGGKTMQLAAAGAQVTALDLSPERLERVAENLARTGLQSELVAADALVWEPPGGALFDAVLVDAPCSATGTIRRHPELPHIRDARRLGELTALQARLLDRAAALTRPGGRIVFCTCSLLPAEGEDHIATALARNPALQLDSVALDLPGVEPGWIGAEGLRTRPDYWGEIGGMDGFFIAALRKSA